MYRRKRFYYYLLLIVIGVPLTATAVQYVIFSNRVTGDASIIAETRLELLRSSVGSWLQDQANIVTYAASQIQTAATLEQNASILPILTSTLRVSPALRSIYFGTPDNLMINASGWVPPAGFDLRTRPWYEKAVSRGDMVYTTPFLNASADAMIVVIAKPVFVDGALLGVVGADIELTNIVKMIEESRITPNSAIYLLSGTSLVASTSKDSQDAVLLEALRKKMEDVQRGTKIIESSWFAQDLLMLETVEGAGWHLGVYIPWDDFLPHARAIWLSFGIIALSASALAAGFVVFYQGQVAGPLTRLEDAINSLSVNDNYSDRIPTAEHSSGGFNGLVYTINELLDRAQAYSLELSASKAEMEIMNARLEVAVTEEREAREELELRQVYWRALFENSGDAIVLVNNDGRILEANSAFAELFEYCLADLKGCDIDNLVAPHRYSEARAISESQLSGKTVYLESTRLTRSGREIEVEIKGVPIIINGEVVGGYAIYVDITRRRDSEREILILSQRDQLTGLYNRAYFDRVLRQLDAEGTSPVSLVVGDTNGLKLVNDAFGHGTGDELLRRTAQIIQSCSSPEYIAARIGGDEFAVVMPRASEREAEALQTCIERRCREQSEGIMQLSIALGVSTRHEGTEKLSNLFVQAEDRMYRRKLREGKSVRNSLIASLMQALQEKTRDTSNHSDRMAELSRALAEQLGITGSNLDDVYLLASLHDIGKIGVPDAILNKPGPLTPDEWGMMKKHSEIGYRIASATVELAHVAEGILYHHERWDGKGYPQGLAGDAIPLVSRIIAVVDAYDAMTNHRPYRDLLSHEQALEEIRAASGRQFSPEVVEAFLALMDTNS